MDNEDSRFKAEDVGNSVGLIPGLGGDLAHCIHEMDSRHPLVDRQLDFPGEVVKMAHESAQNHAVPLGHIGAHRVDDELCEVRVKSMGWLRRVALRGV